jgi:hypothetical protein
MLLVALAVIRYDAKIRRRFGLSDALVVKIIAGFEGLLATACFDF